MYLEHFDLKEFPFTITPNTQYFQKIGTHQEALNTILVGLKSGEGFIKITGEVGTGKTMICRKILTAAGKNYKTVYIPNPCLTRKELLESILEELNSEKIPHDSKYLTKKINKELIKLASASKQVLILIDEAQVLTFECLEMLRLLTNLESENKKLLQIILFGQPELNEKLKQKKLRQLAQRIVFSYELKPISNDTIKSYILQRLKKAGVNKVLFSEQAMKKLYQASLGIPRVINILCHKSLISAYGRGRHGVLISDVKRAIKDTEAVEEQKKSNEYIAWINHPEYFTYGALAVLAIIAFTMWLL